jgi:protein TonB
MLLPYRQNELPIWCGWMVGAATLMTFWASGAAAQRSLTSLVGRPRPGEQNALPTPEGHKVQNCIPECSDDDDDAADDEDADNAQPDDRAHYAHEIQAQIHRRCRYPRDRTKARGVAVVSFSISQNGRLTGACVSRSSGNRELDQIALESVRGAGSFPPTPTGAEMRFSAPFQFR